MIIRHGFSPCLLIIKYKLVPEFRIQSLSRGIIILDSPDFGKLSVWVF